MNYSFTQGDCQKRCWRMAAIAGAVLFVLCWLFGITGFWGGLLVGLIVFVVLALLLSAFMCSGDEAQNRSFAPAPAPTPPASAPTPAPAPAAAAPAPEAPAPTPAAEAAPEPAAQPAPAPASAAAQDDAVIKPSAELPGQRELEARKGSWTYTADGAAAAAPAPASGKDYDGDGVVEGADEGQKPATLSAARDGGADDLKKIKGIGPKLEKLCNSLGFYHFDQIASWTDQEVAWVDANLEGFKGRVTRDTWVAQAKLLAAGGDTEFSKKVDKGDVY